MWQYTGDRRPDFAATPGPDQESVWDYPRPPRVVASDELVDVSIGGIPLASSRSSHRVLETAHPPTYYIPARDVNWQALRDMERQTFCEWKGTANYFSLARNPESGPVARQYRHPVSSFAAIDGHVSFYPALVCCEVNGERVQPQPGAFYGGWITQRVVGPFKGEPGTGHW